MSRPRVHALLTSIEAPPEKVVATLFSLQRTHTPILYLHLPEDQAPGGPEAVSLPCACATLGEQLEKARTSVQADLLLWIPPGVEVEPDGLDRFVEAYEEDPQAALFVSDYLSGGTRETLHPLRDDLTEREDFGAIWGLPVWALEKVGGADPALRHATFHDLRLKLMEVGPVHHITEATHTVPQPESTENAASEALFYPGKGAYGGFSYLFMDKEEEREIEAVHEAMLKRRGAFLEAPENVVTARVIAEDDPLASVIIPVHNRAGFLPLALDSILRGSFQRFEVIVIDNASSDNSLEVAREYARRDPRIKVLSSEVNLIARALNMGVEAARGRYIAQLDSDDEYTPDTLEKMVGHLEAHPRCGLAISYYELMDEGGNTLEEFGIIKHLEYNRNNILRVDGAGAVRVWQRSVILEFGGFNETDFPNYGEDYDLVLKVGERYDVDRVHEVLYRYRRHPGNTDALRRHGDKIEAKTLARRRALQRRRQINGMVE